MRGDLAPSRRVSLRVYLSRGAMRCHRNFRFAIIFLFTGHCLGYLNDLLCHACRHSLRSMSGLQSLYCPHVELSSEHFEA